MLISFGRSWHSHIPLGLLFNFQGTVRRSFTYSHRERSNAPPKREKYLRIKNSLHSFGQRVPKCTPNFRLSPKKFFEKIYPFTCSHWEAPNYRVFMKNFLSGKKPSHLFGIAKPNDTLFHRKIRKYFFGCRCFILLPSKSLFTYSL